MTRWYRAYEGTVTDAKISEAAVIAGCSRSIAIATWHSILENAASNNAGGKFDIPSRRVAAILIEPYNVIETLFQAFESVGLIHDSCVKAWKKRQYESDCSTDRVRKHRDNARNVEETPMKCFVTAPETETETETEKKVKRAARGNKPDRKPVEAFQGTLDREHAEAVVAHRKKIKKPLTFLAASLLAAKFAQCDDPNHGADEMIANGWQGFDASWLQNRANRANGPPGKRTSFDAGMDWIAEETDGKTSEDRHHNVVELLPPAGR